MAGELIRKASGVVAAKSKLSYDDFVNLAKGVDVLTNKEIFKVNWETLTIEIVDVPTRLKGLAKNARLNISVNLGNTTPTAKTICISYPKAYPLIVYTPKAYPLVIYSKFKATPT